MRRLQNKIRNAADRICLFEEDRLEDADVVVVSYGITSRVAQRAIELARERGLKSRQVSPHHSVALSRKEDCRDRHQRSSAFVVPELNLGQMVREVERAAAGKAKTVRRFDTRVESSQS